MSSESRGAELEVVELSKRYGSGQHAVTALAGLSFTVTAGRFVCVVGPSGCGKTTLLNCVAGLDRPCSGEVRFRGKRLDRPPDEFAFVFQDYARSLLPWMTVRGNVMLPLRRKMRGSKDRERVVADAVESVGLSSFLRHYPWQLSGGMQQRVSLARALAYQPELLLLDEPFASVDAQVRADLEDLLMQVIGASSMTSVFVTHDIDEAVYLADEVIVLSARPASVVETMKVDLPRPRDQVRTKSLPEFARLRNRLFSKIMRPQEPAELDILVEQAPEVNELAPK